MFEGNGHQTRVGYIGLGAMGAPMAARLIDSDVALRVFDLRPPALTPFTERGIAVAASPQELGAWADVIICMLPHPDIFREVMLGADGVVHGIRSGALVIDMATDGPEPVRSCAAPLADRGANIIDAPVGRGPRAAAEGTLLVLLGGDREMCDWASEHVLEPLAERFYYCGPLGAGQTAKLANNLVQSTNLAIIAEACGLAVKGGVDLQTLAEIMSQTAADSFQVRNGLMRKALNDDFQPIFRLALAYKDVNLARALARELGTPIKCGDAAADWFEDGVRLGFGDLDQSALIDIARKGLATRHRSS